MKKSIIILLLITATSLITFGCTKLPASQETGVKPSEYEGSLSTKEIKAENENLKVELEETREALEKTEKDFLNLAKSNESIISKLEEAQSKLEIVEGDEIPNFNSEKNDKNSIVAYLNESKSILDDNYKGIQIIKSMDSGVLFYTVGYGDNFSQIFLWEIGQNEPVMIDEAYFYKEGSWKWLLDNKYILIESDDEGNKKVVDIDNKKIASTFKSDEEIYMIPGTTTVLIRRSSSDMYTLYDFVNITEKEINLDYANKYTSYSVDEDNNEIIFKGTYTNDVGTNYSVSAKMDVGKMKEIYEIKSYEATDGIDETNEIVETQEATEIEEQEEQEGNKVE